MDPRRNHENAPVPHEDPPPSAASEIAFSHVLDVDPSYDSSDELRRGLAEPMSDDGG